MEKRSRDETGRTQSVTGEVDVVFNQESVAFLSIFRPAILGEDRESVTSTICSARVLND